MLEGGFGERVETNRRNALPLIAPYGLFDVALASR
jgi:hypothetical protein